jgi:chromosome partitioning protein
MKQDLAKITFNQRRMCFISGRDKSVVSRYINEHKIPFTTGLDYTRSRYSFKETRKVIKDLASLQGNIKEQIQAFFNIKDGAGKTTVCYQIAVHLALLGFSILAIDCDPQASLSSSLGFDEYSNDPTLYDVLVNRVEINELIKPVYPGLDIIPSNFSMSKIEIPLIKKAGMEKILAKVLSPLRKRYDFILIDTNSIVNALSAIYAADRLNIVCETQPYSLKVIEEIKSFCSAIDHKVNYRIIPNKYEYKAVEAQAALVSLRYKYKELVTQAVIRSCADFKISAEKHLPIHAFANSKSMALEDIRDLANELVKDAGDSAH